nr:reverse transcriptase domain-containing protein [Tanacetum cinerariifolium]
SSLGSGTLPSNTIANPKKELNSITTRSGVTYQGPTNSTPSKVVKQRTEVTKDQVQAPSSQSTAPIQPLISQSKTPTPISKPVVAPTVRALVDVHKGELTLRIRNEAITYNLDQTVRNPTPHDDPIVSTTSLTLTLFRDSDFLLFEEADAFLSLEDDPNSPKINPFYCDPEEDILLLETILNSKPLPLLPNHKQYLPSFKKELKVCEAKTVKSFVEEPPEVELKDLPPHLEYAFLEGDNNLPVIIAKELGDEEKSTLLKDYKPAVQHHRRVNPKIHDVIKKEVEKLLDAQLIYPISDSPWVSPVHCVPKKGGFTVVDNEENELIPTHLVIGRRVCIDYQKLNEATRKDHFPLPFMDQMLKRLAENKLYCFLDCFSRYFEIPINPRDQEKTTLTCPYAIFQDMAGKTMEVFIDDFSVFRNSFENCLSHLDKMLQRCEDTNLSLNWEKSHFMVKDGIVIGHKISKNRTEVDRAKVDVIAKLPYPTTVKDYLSKWVHVKALPTNHARVVCKFLESLFARFVSPRAIISDRGTHFCNDLFMKVMLKYGVTHRLSIAYHPQPSGQVEECRAPKSQDRGRRDTFRQGSKVEEQTSKALMAIDGMGWEWSFMGNEQEDHALVADEEDMSWTGLSEYEDDTVTYYSRPSPTIKSTLYDVQNQNASVTKTKPSPSTISPKPFIKFVND